MITGCSTGFGRELARQLLERDFRVVVTARNPLSIRDLADAHPGSALCLALDVTDKAQIARAVTQAQQAFGSIDVLVNNAGYGYYAPVEAGDEAAVRRLFETNFFGLLAMTQAVLPSMRARRSGHVVNISSVGGLVAHPGSGFYAATKFAVEAVSESLSKEVATLGIRVLLVEPGLFKTHFGENAQETPDVPAADYADVAARRAAIQARRGKQPGDPARAAAAIIAAVQSSSPPLRLVLGAQALGQVRAKLNALTAELDAWEATTVGADYPS